MCGEETSSTLHSTVRIRAEPNSARSAIIERADDIGPTIVIHIRNGDLLNSTLTVVPRHLDEASILALIEENGTSAGRAAEFEKLLRVEVSNHNVWPTVFIHIGDCDRVRYAISGG